MKYLLIMFIYFTLSSCNQHCKQINIEELNGKWYLNKWTYYHTLNFDKGEIYVDNHIDSVFILKYKLSNDTLITWSNNSNEKYKNRILKISKDTLILENFLNTKDELHYSKKNRDFEK